MDNQSNLGAPMLLDETAAAEFLGCSVAFLRKDRRHAQLIPFVKLGALVKYRRERLADAVNALEVGGSSLKTARRGRVSA